ncbi:trihelix transcription factor GT-3b-like [Aristolochia californica]|uniref:trihelix transcription factor GT-3b-like n=1 Tax=Aristolochia californica TaxID=171875 RepID=UPI0035D6B272
MMLGSGDNEALSRMGMISGLPLHLNQAAISPDMSGAGGSQKKDDRVPQWSHQETRDFIAIRAELERDFTVAKRNKTLWEVVAAKMKERGYRRTPDQCKCKWKNLVNRYKGKETSDADNGRQCPFFDELHAVFTERATTMQRLLLESESGGTPIKKKMKRLSGEKSSDDFSDEDEDDEDDSEDERTTRTRKRKAEKDRPRPNTTEKSKTNSIHELLQDFLQQQQRMEIQWREMMDRRAQERRLFEQEWRQMMEKMERERLIMEQAWREREEQRRMREETRAEKRDVLISTLLNKLIREDL